MSQRDYYEVLGVARNADADTIKKAYRKLAMQYHPDKNPGDQVAEEKFKEAASAYEVLGSPDKRAQYDRFGHAAFQGGRGGPGAGFADVEDIFSAFGDIFGDIFGGGMSNGRRTATGPRRGSDLRYVTEISLRDVIAGVDKEIEFDVDGNCDSCSGTGAEKGSSPVTCPTCSGRGQVVRQQGFFTMSSTCPACQGAGTMIKNPCKSCKGRGRLKQHRKIRVTIPAGVDTGTRLRVANEGEGGYRGGPTGDLYVEIAVADDPHFHRDGDHLVGELTLDYLQVLLGGEVTVDTVTGKKTLAIPRGTQVGDSLKISGEGIPSLRGSRRGDLFYTVQVRFPEKLNKEEEALLREIAQKRGFSPGVNPSGFWGKKK